MDKLLALIGLLAIVVGFNWRAGRLAQRAVAGQANAKDLQAELTAPVRFLSLLIAPNFLAAFMVASWEAGEATGVVWPAMARVFLGSALLMELASRCAGDRSALEEPIPELVGLRAMRGLFTSVAACFFWAAVGVAALFGEAADRQVASVLAFDCFLLAGLFALAYRWRRSRWELAEVGFCKELDPRPDGGPNMTDLTRSFPIVAGEYNSIRAHQDGRIELGGRRSSASTRPIAQMAFAVAFVAFAIPMWLDGLHGTALAVLAFGGGFVAMLQREKRRPLYRVSIDTVEGMVRVVQARIDARPETFALGDTGLEVERKDEEGYSTQGRLVLRVAGGAARHVLLDWVAYSKALNAARALASHTRLPLVEGARPS